MRYTPLPPIILCEKIVKGCIRNYFFDVGHAKKIASPLTIAVGCGQSL